MASVKKRTRPTAVDLWDANPNYAQYIPRETVQDSVVQVPPPQQPRYSEEPSRAEISYPSDEIHNTHLNPTCVTPFIAELAAPYFTDLVVAGSKQPPGIDGPHEKTLLRSALYRKFLQSLLNSHYGPQPNIHFDNDDVIRLPGRSLRNIYYNKVTVRRETFKLGDIVIIARGSAIPGKSASPLPRTINDHPDIHVGTLFWFVRILSIRREDYTFHGQWLEHGSQTVLEELAHPQELFLTGECDEIALDAIITKCICRQFHPGKRPTLEALKDFYFFYSLFYDRKTGTFADITVNAACRPRCELCSSAEEHVNRDSFKSIRDTKRNLKGFNYLDDEFHYADCLLFSKNGTSVIGQIRSLPEGVITDDFWMTVQLFGRTCERKEYERGKNVGLYEEHHLFLTEELTEVFSTEIIGKCYVLPEPPHRQLKMWIESSPLHFYFSHLSTASENVNGRSPLRLRPQSHEFLLCGYCMEREQTRAGKVAEFLDSFSEKPLRVFDPFAGVGSFALGMCSQKTMQLTHAIDIDTSATRTLRKNSPGTTVYNQCSNKLLESAVKTVSDRRGPEIESLDPVEEEPLADLPKPDEIDCIVSGFPCQPHSSMNKYPKSRDLQNELFLNTVSWVEHLKPKFCIFENVKGFVNYRLLGVQHGRHNVKGGIELGGLKFICRALVTMGYQTRFGLLQAAHYGTPQSRVRFFLIGATSGSLLPDFPKPTHNFASSSRNAISFAIAGVTTAVHAPYGNAPLPAITIEDAIGDLKKWDWENPHKVYSRQECAPELNRRQNIMKVKCGRDMSWCGPTEDFYECPAYTGFQAVCRIHASHMIDIQHITPCFDDATVERAVNISLSPGSDYKSLNTNSKRKLLDQFQMIDPNSANARHGFKSCFYGRLGGDSHFHTIVTNVHPTAKQCWVMNPWCRRIFSVRELARGQGFPDNFEFVTDDRPNIKSMHRGIGNAVPWPLSRAISKEFTRALFEADRGADLRHTLDQHDQDWLNVHSLQNTHL